MEKPLDEQIAESLKRLTLEEINLLHELVDALHYDRNHPGEKTAVLIQEKIRRYTPSKEPAVCK